MQSQAEVLVRSAGHAAATPYIRAPIDIPTDTQPTPAALRSLRIRAGLTKAEAAHLVGLGGKAASWHQYELGRYAIPADKWAEFTRVLRSGRYPSTCFSKTRRGPRTSDHFEVGRLAAPASKKAVIDIQGCEFVSKVRAQLKLSAAELAANLGIESHRVYRIEAASSSPSGAEMDKCSELAKEHLDLLSKARDIESVELREVRERYLRLSCAEAAGLAGLKGSRPGATWSAIESESRTHERAVSRFRKAAADLWEKMVAGLSQLSRQS